MTDGKRAVPMEEEQQAGQPYGDPPLPFCGDEYPPLKDSPGAVICTRPPHADIVMHLNEETGWMWRTSG